MTTPKTKALGWLVEFLSAGLAKHSRLSQECLIAKIKQGLASGALRTQAWVVKWPDGSCSSEEIIPPVEFSSWEVEGLDHPLPFTWQVSDNTWHEINALEGRWQQLTGCSGPHQFRCDLVAAESELAILCWTTKTRSICRKKFVEWYEARPSPRVSNPLSIAIKADDLWPQKNNVESFAGLSREETIKLACRALYPKGIPHDRGADVKGRDNALGKFIEERGAKRPSERTIRNVIKKLTSRA
jgi:hypothetical protein